MPFIEGLAAVRAGRDGIGGGKKSMWGFIDKTGKAVIASQFDDFGGLTEGVAVVQQGKKWGYITKAQSADHAWSRFSNLRAE